MSGGHFGPATTAFFSADGTVGQAPATPLDASPVQLVDAWLRAARKFPIRAGEVRPLAGLMAVGGIGRLISLVHNGRPHWFQEVLTAIEFIIPAAFLGIADAEEKDEPPAAG